MILLGEIHSPWRQRLFFFFFFGRMDIEVAGGGLGEKKVQI